MRVTSDRQTLILAGETPPRVTIISARLDAVVTQGTLSTGQQALLVDGSASDDQSLALNRLAVAAGPLAVSAGSTSLSPAGGAGVALPALAPKFHQAYFISNRGSSSSGASAYERTRDLTERSPPVIDTYA